MTVIGEIVETPKMLELEWRIPDFFSLQFEKGDVYSSPSFSIAGTSCSLNIYLRDTGPYKKYTLSLSRCPSVPPISLEVYFGYKTSDRNQYIEKAAFKFFDYERGVESYIHRHCLSREELLRRKSELSPSNVFTVLCALEQLNSTNAEGTKCSHCKEVVDISDLSSHEKMCVNKPIKCPECSDVVALKNWYDHECQIPRANDQNCTAGSSVDLSQNKVLRDFKELFLQKEDCDVFFKVKGQEFTAHRNILKARSPVLASTFRNDMKEKATGNVEIEDCDPSSFSDFLCFLYCGEENISVENVFSLFNTADKYDVQDLRVKCMEFMKENLSIETFCDTITLALRHSEADLIKLTTNFFLKNAPKLIVTVKWQQFAAENPTQSNELFVKLLVPDNSVSK